MCQASLTRPSPTSPTFPSAVIEWSRSLLFASLRVVDVGVASSVPSTDVEHAPMYLPSMFFLALILALGSIAKTWWWGQWGDAGDAGDAGDESLIRQQSLRPLDICGENHVREIEGRSNKQDCRHLSKIRLVCGCRASQKDLPQHTPKLHLAAFRL